MIWYGVPEVSIWAFRGLSSRYQISDSINRKSEDVPYTLLINSTFPLDKLRQSVLAK